MLKKLHRKCKKYYEAFAWNRLRYVDPIGSGAALRPAVAS